MELIQFLGRLHPLILHLPIGVLVLAFIMECLARKERYKNLIPAIGFTIKLGMWSAIIAAISGYILSLEGGYNETMLNQHQYLGIATAVGSVVLYFLYQRKETQSRLYLGIFILLMLLLGATGHVGGSLTHGSDFLTAPFSGKAKQEKPAITNIDSAFIYQDLIQPIFEEKCVGCHNESKIKGALLMTSIEGLRKGGESGAFFKAGDVTNSLFLQRIHMEIEEEEHMPPKGKRQLTKNEIALLEWWIEEDGDFDKQVSAVNQSETIKAILANYVQLDDSVFALDVPPPKNKVINKLREEGIEVIMVAKERPFVKVSLRGQKNINEKTFKQLRGISEQLIELDLSDTNMDDQLFLNLSDFPHLQKLFLQKTNITGQQMKSIQDLKYLEYLNLYDTPLENVGLASIAKMDRLKNIYLWKTNLSSAAIKELQSKQPQLQINTGVDTKIFGEAQLKAPIVKVRKDIFKDTITVTIDYKLNGVNLFYTLDGTTPDSTAQEYKGPFILTETANVKAIAYKDGWKTSLPAQRVIARSKYQASKITLNIPPNDKYKANGSASLIDFKKGTTDFADGEWLGYQNQHLVVTLDMGKSLELSSVTLSALEATSSYIFFPKGLEIQLSKDGKQFQKVANRTIATATQIGPTKLKNFVLNFPNQEARYIKVKIKSNLVNPDWHPAPGAPCWIFVDELIVD